VPRWVTVRLWTGKPPRRGTRHQAYSAWACLLCRLEWVPGESWGSKHAYCVTHQPVSWSRSVRWLPGWMDWLAEISADLRGSGSALEACSRRCAILNGCVYFTLLYKTIPLSCVAMRSRLFLWYMNLLCFPLFRCLSRCPMFRANFGISFTSLEYWSDYNENLRSVVTTINRRTDYILAELVPRKRQQDMKENSNRSHSAWLHKFDNTYGMLRPRNWRVHWTHAAAEASYDCTVFNSLVFLWWF